ncbi:hypothetical protein PV05_04470 [Exophiala xenobiotica]|uniref:Uncharacterized protein n=1 Tax=Exophiala xenobiotica TaxID=348802 RepID=A0A0D2BTD0_9EURO|nr:uncharacterized protein PV05_04470 [Exophiala xenobiotica]KIW55741.1 hypothetical protein PV05_04470 [Exophiala xenobiotica]
MPSKPTIKRMAVDASPPAAKVNRSPAIKSRERVSRKVVYNVDNSEDKFNEEDEEDEEDDPASPARKQFSPATKLAGKISTKTSAHHHPR